MFIKNLLICYYRIEKFFRVFSPLEKFSFILFLWFVTLLSYLIFENFIFSFMYFIKLFISIFNVFNFTLCDVEISEKKSSSNKITGWFLFLGTAFISIVYCRPELIGLLSKTNGFGGDIGDANNITPSISDESLVKRTNLNCETSSVASSNKIINPAAQDLKDSVDSLTTGNSICSTIVSSRENIVLSDSKKASPVFDIVNRNLSTNILSIKENLVVEFTQDDLLVELRSVQNDIMSFLDTEILEEFKEEIYEFRKRGAVAKDLMLLFKVIASESPEFCYLVEEYMRLTKIFIRIAEESNK